jgi:hypothetical protein
MIGGSSLKFTHSSHNLSRFSRKLGEECGGSEVGETVTRREGWMDVLVTSSLQNMLFFHTPIFN